MPAPNQLRFLFVTGKGGAGKTTVSAALALAMARAGRRVLIATSGAKPRTAELVGSAALSTQIEPLRHNLWGVLLTPEVALREYGTLVLKSPRLVEALFDNKYVQGFFNGAPGLKEWALLGKAWYHTTETLPDGRPRFDVVIFDAPATGHGLDMLRVPKVILSAAPPGRLRTDAERAFSFLRDPSKSGVVVVTLPEEMPTNETLELVSALRDDLALPITEIVLNSALTPLFSDTERAALEPLSESQASDSVLAAASRRAAAERTQSECITRLNAIKVPVRQLLRLHGGASTPDAVMELSRQLA